MELGFDFPLVDTGSNGIIEELETVAPFSVPYNTAFGANGAGLGLPQTLNCIFVGGGLGTVPVTWAIGSYDPLAGYLAGATPNFVATPVEGNGKVNPLAITTNVTVTTGSNFKPIVDAGKTIRILFDYKGLVTNTNNAHGTVNGSNGITEIQNISPADNTNGFASAGTAPLLNGSKRGVYIQTGYHTFTFGNTYKDIHYEATASNYKRTFILAVKPNDTNSSYGLLGNSGFFANNSGFDILLFTSGTDRRIAFMLMNETGTPAVQSWTGHVLTFGAWVVITIEVDLALANGSGRVKIYQDTTLETMDLVIGNGVPGNFQHANFQVGDTGTSGNFDANAEIAQVVVFKGLFADSTERNTFINNMKAYLGI